MLVENAYSKNYLFAALEASPDLYDELLQDLTPEEADLRPDPERFTIKEIMAHLAEWEEIFTSRMKRMCAEEHPTMEGYDEGVLAVEHRYDLTDPLEQNRLFRHRRVNTIAFLRSLSDEQWKRTGNRPEIGIVTVEAIATIMTLHDTYHLKQIAEWRKG